MKLSIPSMKYNGVPTNDLAVQQVKLLQDNKCILQIHPNVFGSWKLHTFLLEGEMKIFGILRWFGYLKGRDNCISWLFKIMQSFLF